MPGQLGVPQRLKPLELLTTRYLEKRWNRQKNVDKLQVKSIRFYAGLTNRNV